MIKRIAFLFGLVSLTVGATFAFFSATADSEDNVVTAGTLKFGSPMSEDFTVVDAAPGETFTGDENPYDVGNKGTIDADHLKIAVSNVVTDEDVDAVPDMDSMLIVSKLLYGDGGTQFNLKSAIEGSPGSKELVVVGGRRVSLASGGTFSSILNAGGKITLGDWEGEEIVISDDPDIAGVPAGLEADSVASFDIDLKFDEDAGNEYQGDSVTTTITFTLNQDSSQK